MKRFRFASLVLLLCTALSSTGQAQSPAAPLAEAIARLDDDGPLSEPRHVGFGMTPEEVQSAMLGKPDTRLTPEIWVYWHFRSGIVGAEKFDTLVVTFSRGRVTQYRLVERQAVLALMEDLRRKARPTVAKK